MSHGAFCGHHRRWVSGTGCGCLCPAGLAAQVELTDVATPYTTWRYTLNRAGAYAGWLPTTQALMTSLPRSLPGLDDCYMAGQWVVPGGGVPTSLASGWDAVRILCRRDGRLFRHAPGD